LSVAGTVSGSPAANAGITAGDTITAIGGQSVSSQEDVAHALVQYHPGNSVSVSWVDASGQSHTTTVTLASGPTA
jgi:S1-C subfamily serine protease